MGKHGAFISTINFKDICENCQLNCCRRFYAVLLPEEEKIFENSSFAIKTAKGDVKAIGAIDGKACMFLSNNGHCMIYENRPFDCRLWPVVVYIDPDTNEKVVYLDLDCPAIRELRIPPSVINRILKGLREIEFDDQWLERYTLAPWPNNFLELFRFK